MNKDLAKHFIALLAILLAVSFLGLNLIAPEVKAASFPTFVEVTDASGLFHRNETWGWAWGDYDQDGYLDLFLGNHPEQGAPASDPPLPSYLMHNNRNGTFSDVLNGSGILPHEDRHDQAWVDYDDDGDLDLWVLIGGRGGSGVPAPKQLYRQGPTGQFTDIASTAGVDYPLARGRGSAWLDYDLDGDLDLYLTSAITDQASNAFFRNNGNGTFTNIATQLKLDPYLGEVTNASVADYDNDGDPDMYVTDRARLYRNDGTQFTAVQSSAGVNTTIANTAAWGDYDNDGDQDLFVSRGRTGDGDYWEGTSDEIKFVGRSESDEDGLDITVSGNGNLTFHLQERAGGFISREPDIIFLGPDGAHPASNPFTINYGNVSAPPAYTPATSEGFFIWQSAPGQFHIRWTAPVGSLIRLSGIITTDTSFTNITELLWEPETTSSNPDRLFRNNGNGTFTEVSAAAGVANGLDNKGATWGDFDNDGYLDLFVQTLGTMGTHPANLLYRNNGDGTFTEVANQVGVAGVREGAGWGALWGDYDNDGFLDLLTNQATWPWPLDTGSYELFHNQGNANRWLKVDLRGVQANSRGYGAKIWVTAGGMTQFREVNDSSHYFNHYAGPVHFGLGQSTLVDELRVVWPTGVIDVLRNISADRLVTVVEGSSPGGPTPTSTPTLMRTNTPTPTLTPTQTPQPSGVLLRLSLVNDGPYAVGSVAGVQDEDILSFNGADFTMFFDGSDVAVDTLDLDAFYLVDGDTLLLSFNDAATIGSLGTVDDSDIVQFDATSLGTNTAGTFNMFFDASLVGLDTDDEDVDAIELLPDGRLLISTVGRTGVPGLSGTWQDEDLLAFSPSAPGNYSSGTWAVYFDGSDVSLGSTSGEDVDGIDVASNGNIYLTTIGSFAVSGVSGADEDVFVCGSPVTGATTACTFSPTLFFDGSVWGLGANDVDAIALP